MLKVLIVGSGLTLSACTTTQHETVTKFPPIEPPPDELMVSPPIIEYLPVNEDGSANQEEAKRVMAINNLNHGITRIRLDELQAWVRELVDARSRDPNPPPE